MILVDRDAWDEESKILYATKKHRQNGIKEDPISSPKIFLLATRLSPNERDEHKSIGVDDILIYPFWPSNWVQSYREALGSDKSQLYGKKTSNLENLLRQKRILVADDNAVNRKVAKAILQKYGTIVTCMGSGKAALNLLKPPHSFDACFMDLQMPEMDG